MKILLLGASGQVGFELQRSPAPLGNVMAPTRAALDLADLNCVAGFLRHFAPDLIVNAAAWTAVDAAEEHQEEAYQLNAELPEQLAYYAHQHGKWLVHYSSDYVYAGAGERPHQEDDPASRFRYTARASWPATRPSSRAVRSISSSVPVGSTAPGATTSSTPCCAWGVNAANSR